MIYTIASTMDYNGMMYVDFVKHGNKYMVELTTNKGAKETTRKAFARIDDALATYQKYVEAFIRGDYDYVTRKSWLAD